MKNSAKSYRKYHWLCFVGVRFLRAKVPEVESIGVSAKCLGKRCGVYNSVEGRPIVFPIRNNSLNCNYQLVMDTQCKTCHMQYIGSASTSFRVRFNNYKCHHRKHSSGKTAPQHLFHSHFPQDNHNGMEDWQFILIVETTDLDSIRRKESFWQCKPCIQMGLIFVK